MTRSITTPTVATLNRWFGFTKQRMARGSASCAPYVTWYAAAITGEVHAVAHWRIGESGRIEALCSRPAVYWIEAPQSESTCETCRKLAPLFMTRRTIPA